MMLNPFTDLLNNNDVKPITGELVESEIPHKQTELLCSISDLLY